MFDLDMSILDSEYGEELDEGRLEEYISGLTAEFVESPEAEAFLQEFDSSLGWSDMYMHYAGQYFCATPATITSGESEEILFEIVPRKVSVEAAVAHEIVAELRAFWTFLKRTRSLTHADIILESLTDDSADHLEAELADPNNFGMAKSFFMKGKEAGYDMTNEADLQRFVLAYNASLQAEDMPSASEPDENDDEFTDPMQTTAAPIRNTTGRVGRNDPCPCGSGRKYKKCCGP